MGGRGGVGRFGEVFDDSPCAARGSRRGRGQGECTARRGERVYRRENAEG